MQFLSKIIWLLFSFNGRLSRLGYSVGVVLSEGVLVAVAAAIEPFVKVSHSPLIVWAISAECFLLLWTNIALKAKRLHDCGFSGLWSVPCSPVCVLLFLFLYDYKSPLLLGGAGLASVIAVVFMTTFRDDKQNAYGTPGSGIFPHAYIGNTALKQLSDKLDVLDRQLAAGKLSAPQHADACRKLIDTHKALLE